MKKLIYGAAAALLICAASCGKSDESNAGAKYFSAQASDSLLMALGQSAGSSISASIMQQMESDSTVSKMEFLKGLQYGMAADTNSTFLQGMYVGMQMQNQLKTYRQLGAEVNSRVAVEYFKKAFMADTLPSQIEMTIYQEQLRRWTDSLVSAKRAYDRAMLESTPEAQENLEKGINYIKAKKAQNDSVKVTESGLGYKIIDQGSGQKVNVDGRVALRYVARTSSGHIIDRANGVPMSLKSRPEGLKEGVALLNEGGKAELYVPGKLAYGVEAPQGMPIGPNELVVYEVEVLPAQN